MSGIVHGGIDYAELHMLGIPPAAVLDFSSNVNPFGPPAAVRRCLAALDPAPYPDRQSTALRGVLSERYGCPVDALLAGNGSAELIHLISRALLRPGDGVVVIEPAFGEYAHAAALVGARVVRYRAGPERDFGVDVDGVVQLIDAHRPRLVWVCTPNNPAGTVLCPAALKALATACAATGGFLVVDAAYAGLEREGAPPAGPQACGDSMLWLYSLTKAYALAGLRLGFLLGPPRVVARVAGYQPPWSVNSAAQAAGLAALEDAMFLPETLPRLWQASDRLRMALVELGLNVRPSALPFFLVRVGDGAAVRAALLRRGCLVRDCASFGLPAYVRVAPRSETDNERLIVAWRDVCRHES